MENPNEPEASVTVNIGSIVEFEHNVYIVVQSDTKHDDQGRSVVLWCMDPLLVEERRAHLETQRMMHEQAKFAAKILPDIERHLGEDDRGPSDDDE